MSIALLIGLTLLLIIYLLLNRFLGKYISANARYISGLILLIAFLLPHKLSLVVLPMPNWMGSAEIRREFVSVDLSKDEESLIVLEKDTETTREQKEDLSKLFLNFFICGIYLIGVFYKLLSVLRKHIALRKTIDRALVEPSKELSWQFDMLCGKMEFRRKPQLLVCRSSVALTLGAPFTFGIFKRKVVLPSDVYGEDAEMLIAHELYHCKRYDTLFRLALMLVSVLYWFYLPIIPFVRSLYSVCEESCDASMTENQNNAYRAAYGKLLVRYASKNMPLPVSFSCGGKKLKKRIETLFSKKRRQEGYALICLTAYLCVMLMGTSFSAPHQKTVLYQGEDYFEHADISHSKDGIRMMENELFHAFSQLSNVNLLTLCRYSVQTGELTYAKSDDLYYSGRFIATVIVESQVGNHFSAVSTYCDEKLAKNCVGIRLIYQGDRKDDGSMSYRYIVLLSDKELLDHYVWLLLPEDERGATVYDLSAYDREDGWEERILSLAREKDPDVVPFYRALIERVS